MSKSVRIRTEVGKDKQINVLLEQDFESLEILSLKLLQSDIYTRPCSDYGVIVGRVSINNGYGIPNAKVSVFIPLDANDELDPIISTLYPYKNVENLNEDGYRYNLLPYTKSYSAHQPTGTFFDKEDVLINPYYIQVFDKYYKYTARTNNSGDFLIFGAPLGNQTIHVDIDLSDIGEFSLTPQDLVRMGVATENQTNGTTFKTSSNLAELPQIVSLNRIVEVNPFWGEPDVCNLGITRVDFDITNEKNINLVPTAIFMGSLFSSEDDTAQKRNCKPKLKQGMLCNLTTGPGEIKAIRQMINLDVNGRPGLEPFELENGGQVIDDNGAWVIDVPMNLDRVVTNEFGENVFTIDPKKGVPTSAKYRFKIKWNQPPTLKEPVKRGYFLVPNIREYWTSTTYDPLDLPTPPPCFYQNVPCDYTDAMRAYSFSLDWNDYGFTGDSRGQQMIQDAINCEDRFYYMQYNKVYTVSGLVTQYRNGYLSNRIISLKDDLNTSCESENNKFPTNDANFTSDFLFVAVNFLLYIFRYALYSLLIVTHIFAFFVLLLSVILAVLVFFVMLLFVIPVCYLIQGIIEVINFFGGDLENPLGECPNFDDILDITNKILNLWRYFTNLPIPNLTYPDCDFCNCAEGETPAGSDPSQNPATSNAMSTLDQYNVNSTLSQYWNANLYKGLSSTENPTAYQSMVAGTGINITSPTAFSRAPQSKFYDTDDKLQILTTSLPISERINLFNTKAKYFNGSTFNPGGGVNRIKVSFASDLNPTTFHYDNVVVLSLRSSELSNMTAGRIISFQNPMLSTDPNLTGSTLNDYSNTSVTGTSLNGGGVIPYEVQYANPNGTGNVTGTTYTISASTGDTQYLKFPTDIEYFQVITAMTVSDFSTKVSPFPVSNSFYPRFLNNGNYIFFRKYWNPCLLCNDYWYFYSKTTPPLNTLGLFQDYDKQVIVICVRGVDPQSTRQKCTFDLSYIFGYSSWGTRVITGNYKLNIPIQGKFLNVNHSNITSHNQTDSYSGLKLYYPSYNFVPSVGTNGFTAFTTNLTKFYSSLGNNYYPGLGVQNVFLNWSSSYGLNVKGGNAFCWEWSDTSGLDYNARTGVNNITATQDIKSFINDPSTQYNRGYFINEIVEGGSLISSRPASGSEAADVRPTKFGDTNSTNNGGVFPIISNKAWLGTEYSDTGQPGKNVSENPWTINGVEFSYSFGNISMTINPSNFGSSGNTIVMRSDRLPTSSNQQNYAGVSYCLQNNQNFSIYLFSDVGLISTPSATATATSQQFSSPNENQNDLGSFVPNAVFDSFTCGGFAPLGCYYESGGTILVKPKTDDCYTNGLSGSLKAPIMKNGCYIFVSAIFFSLPKDFKLLGEWISRTSIAFGACRNVFGHMFTNNWLNGSLYAFPIINDRFFTSPAQGNKPYSLYCKDTVVLNPKTNNYFYRVSPFIPDYDGTKFLSTGAFIGKPAPKSSFLGVNLPDFGGNVKNLNYPTTMLDLGPKNYYLQEIVLSDKFDGYVVNRLNSTTYSDVSEILNLFIISRLTNTNFIQQIVGGGGANIFTYFSRDNVMVDGDYAQSISTSSELGVAPFQAENYPAPVSGQNPIYASPNDETFGIFFSADTQLKDWISPKRTIINSNLPVNNSCIFSNYGVFSQVVPHYQWHDEITTAGTIFGTQDNTWHTNTINNGYRSDSFFSFRYQDMDRINKLSRYFRTKNTNSEKYFHDFIYGINGGGTLSAAQADWDSNQGDGEYLTMGAPYYFYFGLKKGKTAFDIFGRKYLNFEDILDE